MLAPDYLDHAPDRLVLLWQQVEDDILRDVARRISKMETLTPTANWQLWRYQQVEAVRQDVVKKLARYTGKSEAEIRRLMQEAATRAMEAEDEIYYHYGKDPTPFADNATLQALLNAGYQQTAGTFHNLTATTANTVSGQFEAALDRAHLKVSSGAFDYKSAVKSAVDSLADTMKYVTYPTGHTDTLEVACRRAVLTGVNQTGAKLQVARADEMGVEFFETTAHGGARPSHAEWQGRQFHRGGAVDCMGKHYPDFEAATGYATGGRADSSRTSVAGFGRSASSKASFLARKQEHFDAANTELQQMREAGTIKARGKLIESPPAPNVLNFASEHVLQRWAERGMGPMDAERIIRSSKVAMSQRNGTQTCYYSEHGFVAIGQDGNVASIGPLDEGGKKLMEVVKKHGLSH